MLADGCGLKRFAKAGEPPHADIRSGGYSISGNALKRLPKPLGSPRAPLAGMIGGKQKREPVPALAEALWAVLRPEEVQNGFLHDLPAHIGDRSG